jgi:hypothetical protein
MKCVIRGCFEKANYNYKTNFNPAYCHKHNTSDMKKIGSYTFQDMTDIIIYKIFKF